MSLMSASYPGYSNYPTIGWRGNASGHIPIKATTNVSHEDLDHEALSPTTMHHLNRNTHAPPIGRTAAIPFDRSNSTGFISLNPTVTRGYMSGGMALSNEDLSGERKMMSSSFDISISRSKSDDFIGSPQSAAAGSTTPWVKKSVVAPPVVPTVGSPKRSTTEIEKEINGQNLYKTELCRSFIETGMCKYGTKCQFAHGRQELRPVLRHPKYKTEICKTFQTMGTCPYGARCRFIHKKPGSDISENTLFFPPLTNSENPNPDWGIWNDDSFEENVEEPTSTTPTKERRKTSESLPQMQQKIDKHKALRNQTRQRSNTDSPPPRRRTGSHIAAVPRVSSPIVNGHTKKEIDNKRISGTWRTDLILPELFHYEDPENIASDPSDLCVLSPPHSPSTYSLPSQLMMPLPPIPYPIPDDPSGVIIVNSNSKNDSCVDPLVDVIDSSVLSSPGIATEKAANSPLAIKREAGTRQRSNSSSSRLPIFQVLCTEAVSEEDLAISISACNLNSVLSSSS